jgi:hypothetical protein
MRHYKVISSVTILANFFEGKTQMLFFMTLFFMSLFSLSGGFHKSFMRRNFATLKMGEFAPIQVGSTIPEGIIVDVVSSADGLVCSLNEAQDIGVLLKSFSKAILFAVPVSSNPFIFFYHVVSCIIIIDKLIGSFYTDMFSSAFTRFHRQCNSP